MPEAARARDDDVRDLAGALRLVVRGRQPPAHGVQVHPRGVEARRRAMQVTNRINYVGLYAFFLGRDMIVHSTRPFLLLNLS